MGRENMFVNITVMTMWNVQA